MQCSAVQCSAVQCSAVQCSAGLLESPAVAVRRNGGIYLPWKLGKEREEKKRANRKALRVINSWASPGLRASSDGELYEVKKGR